MVGLLTVGLTGIGGGVAGGGVADAAAASTVICPATPTTSLSLTAGKTETFTVPTTSTSLSVDAIGGSGGSADADQVVATIPVNSGDKLSLSVGSNASGGGTSTVVTDTSASKTLVSAAGSADPGSSTAATETSGATPTMISSTTAGPSLTLQWLAIYSAGSGSTTPLSGAAFPICAAGPGTVTVGSPSIPASGNCASSLPPTTEATSDGDTGELVTEAPAGFDGTLNPVIGASSSDGLTALQTFGLSVSGKAIPSISELNGAFGISLQAYSNPDAVCTSDGADPTDGTLSFAVDGHPASSCQSVPLTPYSSEGSHTTLPQYDCGAVLAAGSHSVKVTYSGDADFLPTSVTEPVTTSATTISEEFGGANSDGSVYFSVSVVPVNTDVQLTGKLLPDFPPGVTGTCTPATPDSAPTNLSCQADLPAGPNKVTFSYSGGPAEDAAASMTFTIDGAGAATPPTTTAEVTAKVTSRAGKSKYGWYRTPLTIIYTCNSAVASCPKPLTVDRSGRSISVSRTAQDEDGSTTTVTSGPFRIDLVKPTVNVKRLSHDRVACSGNDALSGLATLNCVHRKVKHGLKWTAIAKDRAGNVARKSIVVSDT